MSSVIIKQYRLPDVWALDTDCEDKFLFLTGLPSTALDALVVDAAQMVESMAEPISSVSARSRLFAFTSSRLL